MVEMSSTVGVAAGDAVSVGLIVMVIDGVGVLVGAKVFVGAGVCVGVEEGLGVGVAVGSGSLIVTTTEFADQLTEE